MSASRAVTGQALLNLQLLTTRSLWDDLDFVQLVTVPVRDMINRQLDTRLVICTAFDHSVAMVLVFV